MQATKCRAAMLGALAMVLCPAVAHAADGGGKGGGASLEVAAATLAPNDFRWQDAGGTTPVRVVISIGDQRAYVYRGDQLVAVSAVSTGKDGKETPAGVYPILQKQVSHHSSLYNDASMPYMERLTWDGIAIHAGNNPGFPASHGCIRVPLAFAKKLYGVTQIGSVVEVLDDGGTTDPDPLDLDLPLPSTASETAAANRAVVSLD